jgi:hypothetical protein
MIRVAGLRLLQSYDSIDMIRVAGLLFCSHMTVYRQYLDGWIMTFAASHNFNGRSHHPATRIMSILSYDARSHNPATWIMSIQSYDRRSHHPATRIMGVLYNMSHPDQF